MKFPIRLIPDDTKIPFMRLRLLNFTLSGLLSVLSIVLFVFVGPDYGIDFRGGTIIEVKPLTQQADIAEIRSSVTALGLGDVQVTEVTDTNGETSILIRLQQQDGGEEAQQAAISEIRDALGSSVEFRRVEIVGPRVSGELAFNGAIGMAVALFLIMIYIWFRFEWQFAIGAIVSTLHDLIVTLGFFALFKLEFNLASIAALLTIVGYSLNDTVVVYDRIRETLRKYKKMPIDQLIDRAINDTLARTTVTGLTTLIALAALYFFGGEVISDFVLAMMFGVLIGTYSSIFIAAPMLIYFGLRPGDLDKDKDKDTQKGKDEAGSAKPAGA
jgi:preprotein translocase subunit SecF